MWTYVFYSLLLLLIPLFYSLWIFIRHRLRRPQIDLEKQYDSSVTIKAKNQQDPTLHYAEIMEPELTYSQERDTVYNLSWPQEKNNELSQNDSNQPTMCHSRQISLVRPFKFPKILTYSRNSSNRSLSKRRGSTGAHSPKLSNPSQRHSLTHSSSLSDASQSEEVATWVRALSEEIEREAPISIPSLPNRAVIRTSRSFKHHNIGASISTNSSRSSQSTNHSRLTNSIDKVPIPDSPSSIISDFIDDNDIYFKVSPTRPRPTSLISIYTSQEDPDIEPISQFDSASYRAKPSPPASPIALDINVVPPV